jgi:tetratricopeptide (TPR) repeat protein
MPRQALSQYERARDGLQEVRRLDPAWNRESVLRIERDCTREIEGLREFCALSDGRLAEALSRFTLQQAADPFSSRPFVEIGDFYFGERDYDNAMRQYDEALKRDPGDIAVQMNIARIHSRRGDLDKAKQIYQKIIAASPDLAVAHYNLGGIYFRLKKPTYALREYTRALEIQPDYPAAHNAIGVLCKQLRRYDEAVMHFKNAIALDPGYAAAYENLGLAYMAKNNYPTALNYLRKAVDLFGPESPEGRAIAAGIKRMRRYR